MRISTCLLGCVLLAFCMIEDSEAVACTSLDPPTPDSCTDCTDEDNATNDDCTTTTSTTTTTESTTTSTATNSTVKRKRFRMKLNYTAVRRVRVYRNNQATNTLARKKKANNARVVGVIVG